MPPRLHARRGHLKCTASSTHHRQVAPHLRKARNLLVARPRCTARRRHIQLEQDRRICKIHRLEPASDAVPRASPPAHRGAARARCAPDAAPDVQPASKLKDSPHPRWRSRRAIRSALDVVEIDRDHAPPCRRPTAPAAARRRRRRRASRSRASCRLCGDEARAVLEQADPVLLATLILERRRQQARPQRHAHHRQIARDRVRQREPRLLREQPHLQRRIHEGKRDRLLVAARGERLEQRAAPRRALRAARGSAAAPRRRSPGSPRSRRCGRPPR